MEMRFRLYDADRGDTPIFSEEYTGDRPVTVHAGRFEVQLGSIAPGLQTAIAGADALSLGIEVRLPGTEDWVPLAGRQAITPAPYAMWAAQGSDFTIARDAFVGRNLDVIGTSRLRGNTTLDGTLTATGAISTSSTLSSSGNASVGGTLSVTGAATLASSLTVTRNVTGGAWTPTYANWHTFGTGSGGAAIYNVGAAGSDQALMIVGNNSAGGVRRVKMWDQVTVNGNLDATGTISGNIQPNNVALTGPYTAQAIGDGYVAVGVNMVGLTNTFCFLTNVRSPDDNDEDDQTQCVIYPQDGVWRMEARTSADEAGNTDCQAYCFKYR
jgi:hypothetical protein